MMKYKLHYAIALPAIILVLFFKGIPLYLAFHMSFTEYQPTMGVADSPWAGWSNFTKIGGSFAFHQVFINTLRMNLLSIILGGTIALILALALSGIKSARIRGWFQTIFLLPYFIPAVVMAYIAMLLVSPSQSSLFRGMHVLLQRRRLECISAILVVYFKSVPVSAHYSA